MQPKLPKIKIEIEVRDKDGKLIEKRTEKGNSWTRNIIAMLYCQWANTTTSYLIDTGGTARAYSGSATAMYVNAGSGVDTYGLQVGASDAAFDVTQYSLQAKIANGSAANQLQYGTVSVDPPSSLGGAWQIRVIRVFSNVSGASVTVKEIGLVGQISAGYNFLIARDVISPISVPNGSSLTVRYLISVS